jgi:hypothetical protein
MPRTERFREPLSGLPAVEYLNERVAAGWRLVALEWERDTSETAPPSSREWIEEVPYGLQVSDDCSRLVENTAETEIIVLALDMIVEDCPLSRVADELNRRRYRTRDGNAWTAGMLFDLLPRMIEVSPRLFGTPKWTTRRQTLARISGGQVRS